MKVLLTGASGAVGVEALPELIAAGRDVRTFDLQTSRSKRVLRPFADRVEQHWGDLRDPSAVGDAVEDVDAVIHLGAVIPPLADRQPQLTKEVNTGGTGNLVRALAGQRPGAFLVYASSVSVYGDRVASPWINIDDPLQPSEGDLYAQSKIEAEALIRNSGLQWSILRLTSIMGPDMAMDPLMFHMPLDTSMEILTRRDTGLAMAKAVGCNGIVGRTFNLSGGTTCRTTFRELLDRVFDIVGLGAGFLAQEAFAERNFHCGWYLDADELEDLLHFRRESLEDLLGQIEARTTVLSRNAARLFRPLVRWWLLRQSEPLQVRRGLRPELAGRFFPAGNNGSQ